MDKDFLLKLLLSDMALLGVVSFTLAVEAFLASL
jgi:hypothetical protein